MINARASTISMSSLTEYVKSLECNDPDAVTPNSLSSYISHREEEAWPQTWTWRQTMMLRDDDSSIGGYAAALGKTSSLSLSEYITKATSVDAEGRVIAGTDYVPCGSFSCYLKELEATEECVLA